MTLDYTKPEKIKAALLGARGKPVKFAFVLAAKGDDHLLGVHATKAGKDLLGEMLEEAKSKTGCYGIVTLIDGDAAFACDKSRPSGASAALDKWFQKNLSSITPRIATKDAGSTTAQQDTSASSASEIDAEDEKGKGKEKDDGIDLEDETDTIFTGDYIKKMLLRAKSDQLQFAFGRGAKAGTDRLTMHPRKDGKALAGLIKKDNGATAGNIGTVTVKEGDVNFYCENKPVAGLGRQIRALFQVWGFKALTPVIYFGDAAYVDPAPERPTTPAPRPSKRTPQVQAAIAQRLATFETLRDGLPSRVQGGERKRLQLARGIDEYLKYLNALGPIPHGKEEFDALRAQLTKKISELRPLHNNVSRETFKEHGATMLRAVEAIEKETEALLDDLRHFDQATSDPHWDSVSHDLTVEQAIHAKRCGIPFEYLEIKEFHDHKLNEGKTKNGAASGACNSVDKLVFGDDKLFRQTYYFKPEKATEDAGSGGAGLMKEIGISLDDPRCGNRNIASSMVAGVLGTTVLPAPRFAIHGGKVGLLMDKASGVPPTTTRMDTPMRREKLKSYLKDFEQRKISVQEMESLAGFRQNPDGSWTDVRGEDVGNLFPRARPTPEQEANLHQQLNALEWCDVLSGQMDRHAGNYLVDINGDTASVTGIDNDIAFGRLQTSVQDEQANSAGKPHLIDLATFDHLTGALATFDGDLRPRLAALLTREEVDATWTRLNAAAAYAQTLSPDYVVEDWKTWRSPNGLTATEYLGTFAAGSIFARDIEPLLPSDAG